MDNLIEYSSNYSEPDVYGFILKMKQLILMIILLLIIILNHLNIRLNCQEIVTQTAPSQANAILKNATIGVPLTLKRLGGQFDPTCGFSNNVYSKERVKPWYFVTFNIITSQIFPENFNEIFQIVQKI